jgi:acetyltransferase
MNNLIEEFKDRTGQIFFIRPITPEDKSYLRIGLKEMSMESRRQRFQSGKSDFNEAELKFLTEVDHINHTAFVVYTKQSGIEVPAGVIRGVRDNNRSFKLEIAVTIIDHFQHRGLGLKLFEILRNWAIKNNYTHFVGDLHNSNEKMLKLLQKFDNNHQKLLVTHVGDGFLYFELQIN